MPEEDDQLDAQLRKYVAFRREQAVDRSSQAAQQEFARELDAAETAATGRWHAAIRWLGEKRRPVTFSVAALLVAAAFVIFGLFSVTSDSIEQPGRSEHVLGGGATLPRNLRLIPREHRVELYEGAERIGGTLVPTNAPPGVHGFAVEMKHTNAVGAVERVYGVLWVTNAPGRSRLKAAKDIEGAYLDGVFELPGRLPARVQMEFGERK